MKFPKIVLKGKIDFVQNVEMVFFWQNMQIDGPVGNAVIRNP